LGEGWFSDGRKGSIKTSILGGYVDKGRTEFGRVEQKG
jgi:hypothetical protein